MPDAAATISDKLDRNMTASDAPYHMATRERVRNRILTRLNVMSTSPSAVTSHVTGSQNRYGRKKDVSRNGRHNHCVIWIGSTYRVRASSS